MPSDKVHDDVAQDEDAPLGSASGRHGGHILASGRCRAALPCLRMQRESVVRPQRTGGRTLKANMALLIANARLAAQIAVAVATRMSGKLVPFQLFRTNLSSAFGPG